MANIRRTAMGNGIDMDMLRLANENTIAVGNAKTNARGDLLGEGGKIIKTRAQIMQDYHRLNTQMASDDEVNESAAPQADITSMMQPTADDTPVAESATTPNYIKPRGSFAEAVAGETEVKQELLEPLTSRNKGIQRI